MARFVGADRAPALTAEHGVAVGLGHAGLKRAITGQGPACAWACRPTLYPSIFISLL
jgi:hypothetical protein